MCSKTDVNHKESRNMKQVPLQFTIGKIGKVFAAAAT